MFKMGEKSLIAPELMVTSLFHTIGKGVYSTKAALLTSALSWKQVSLITILADKNATQYNPVPDDCTKVVSQELLASAARQHSESASSSVGELSRGTSVQDEDGK